MGETCLKLTNKGTRATSMTLLLTLNRFHPLFWCFHCWLWTSKCRLGYFNQVWFITHTIIGNNLWHIFPPRSRLDSTTIAGLVMFCQKRSEPSEETFITEVLIFTEGVISLGVFCIIHVKSAEWVSSDGDSCNSKQLASCRNKHIPTLLFQYYSRSIKNLKRDKLKEFHQSKNVALSVLSVLQKRKYWKLSQRQHVYWGFTFTQLTCLKFLIPHNYVEGGK